MRKMLVFALAATVLLPSCDEKPASEVKVDPGKAKPSDPVTTPPKDEVKPAPSTGATEYVAPDGSFTVMSKLKPTPKALDVPTPAGNAPTKQYMFSAPGRSDGAMMVMVSTYPIKGELDDAARQKLLTDARDGVVKKFSGTASDDNTFELDGHPGRDFKFAASHSKMGELVGRSKILLKGNMLFQVMRMGDPKATDFIAEGDALIDSFKFKK